MRGESRDIAAGMKAAERIVAIDRELNRRVAAGADRWQAYADVMREQANSRLNARTVANSATVQK